MSHNQKSTHPHKVTKLVEEVLTLSDDDAFTLHGIEFYEDDRVYDTIDEIEYATLLEWAEAQISAMYDAKFEKRHPSYSNDE